MSSPVLNVAQMREWETATWASGQTEAEVIRQVGVQVARRSLELTRPGDRIVVLAGKGNNGADARRACEHLVERRIEKVEVADPAAVLPEIETLLARSPALVIDGLFGIGLNRPLAPEWIQLIERINQAKVPVLAVDVPSGINADTGEHFGAAIQAHVTLTVGAPKIGLLHASAWPYVGRLEVAREVGLVPCPVETDLLWTGGEDFGDYPPRRPAATHKGSYGHLAIIAGSMGFHGAAVLAARGAQRARPGLITLHTPESVYRVAAAQLQAVMVRMLQPEVKLPGPWTAVLVGPGLAAADLPEQTRMLTRLLWRDSPLPVVVDASALDWLPLEAAPKNAIRVMTPHPGEAARLLSGTPQNVQSSRVQTLRDISKRFSNCWVILKGHQTLIGRSSGKVYVNSSGNPYMAQGGSGDLLSGFLAALLAQPGLQGDVARALRYAVWEHGAAADRLQTGRRNWVVEDLAEELGAV